MKIITVGKLKKVLEGFKDNELVTFENIEGDEDKIEGIIDWFNNDLIKTGTYTFRKAEITDDLQDRIKSLVLK